MSDFKIVQLLNPFTINTTITPTGVYNPAFTYGVGDSVSFGNSSYVAIQPTTGNAPTNTTYWQLLATASTNKLTTTARNQTGSTIPKGMVVYFSGASGNLPTLALAQANNEANSTRTIGITAVAINNNANGEIVVFGLAESLNTSALAAGSSLWLSPTIPGGLTTVKPIAPDHAVFVGFCTRSHPTDGTIEVKIQNGFELEELHNVLITSLVDNQVLKYDAPNSLWKNETLVKDDVGLSNVDNTSDLNKPISTATQTALNFKYDASNPASYVDAAGAYAAAPVQSVAGKVGTVTLVKADVGLSNVDNTSDTDKPISTATQTALNGKENSITPGTTAQYWRGDKTFQTLNKAAVGLSNVPNIDATNRSNHTGTQLATTISDFNSASDARVSIGISNHEAATDPHPQYTTDIESIVNALIFG